MNNLNQHFTARLATALLAFPHQHDESSFSKMHLEMIAYDKLEFPRSFHSRATHSMFLFSIDEATIVEGDKFLFFVYFNCIENSLSTFSLSRSIFGKLVLMNYEKSLSWVENVVYT